MECTPADEVLVAAVRMAMGISAQAADQIDTVSAVQLRALTVLQENPAVNLVQLAQAMGTTVSTASRLVDRLVAAGLTDRRPSPQTRREITLSLTPAGSRTLDRYDSLRLAAVRGCLERLPARQQETVVAALAALVDAGRSASPDGNGSPVPASPEGAPLQNGTEPAP
ncbi:MarR family transcriptional regulator [Geodermatophilus sp. TF02-6]|uniref:MarR family winged helix-turn-helix transcriptional regulator n=1 Tax=Geodermatophilus sp. TF02-6 TaxID=2250575 RepID=UPI000DEBCBAA|nr:MarR family transcriptional regulator [Geodermatophilus sp. TF02-6]RBY82370.1 MarR family transcriptional regulator [Geodermatophilus sp. TF02-6]